MAALLFPERSSATRIGVEPAAFVPEFAPGFRVALAPGPDGAGGTGAAFCDGNGLPGPVDRVAAGAVPAAGGVGTLAPGANGDGAGEGDGTTPGAAGGVFGRVAPGKLMVGPVRARSSSRSDFQRSSIVMYPFASSGTIKRLSGHCGTGESASVAGSSGGAGGKSWSYGSANRDRAGGSIENASSRHRGSRLFSKTASDTS
jgi:hypothetical protein